MTTPLVESAEDAPRDETDRFYVTGGTLRHDDPSYVPREADRALLAGLLAGEFCYVLDSRQIGKSSLMVRVAEGLRNNNAQVAVLDLTALGQNLTPEQWYYGMLLQLGEQLGVEEEFIRFWQGNKMLGPAQRWFSCLRRVCLTSARFPIVVFVDEIDAVRSLPFATDEFFAAIRHCYNERAEDPLWRGLSFCLLGVATPADLIRDVRTTPFNIGRRIELEDFSATEAAPLAQGLATGGRDGARLLKRILWWTGGHPYLTQRLCQAMAEAEDASTVAAVDGKCTALFFSTAGRETDDNLAFVRHRLLNSQEDRAGLLDLYRRVRQGHRAASGGERDPLAAALQLSGIVRRGRGRLRVRNQIYYHVFDTRWVRESMPDAEIRRQTAAFRRALLRTTSVAAVLIAVLGGLSLRATRSERQARKSALSARHSEAGQRLALTEAKSQRDIAQQAVKREHGMRAAEQKQEQSAIAAARAAARSARLAGRARQQAQKEKSRADVAATGEIFQRLRAQQQTLIAQQQAALAGRQAQRARRNEAQSARLLYVADMNLAQHAWDEGNDVAADALLTRHRPHPGQLDQPGWEWRHLWQLCHADRYTLFGHTDNVADLSFAPNGRQVATASEDGTVRIWSTATGRCLRSLQGNGGRVWCVAYSPDGHVLASSSEDRRIRTWQADTGAPLGEMPQQEVQTTTIAFGSDQRTLIAGTQAGSVEVWDVSTKQKSLTLAVEPGVIHAVAFCRAGNRFAAGGDHLIRVWDSTGARLQTIPAEGAVHSLSFSRDGQRLAVGCAGAGVFLYDTSTGQTVERVGQQAGAVRSVAFSPDSRRLATGGADRTVRLWDADTGRLLRQMQGHAGAIRAVSFSPDGQLLATGSDDNTAKLWKTGAAPDPLTLGGHRAAVLELTFSHSGRRLASGGGDRMTSFWDIPTGRRLWARQAARIWIQAAALSPDGRRLVTGAAVKEGAIRLWDTASGELLPGPPDAGDGTWSLAFSPDGRTLVVGGENGSTELRDARGQWPVRTRLFGAFGRVLSVAFSPDGRLLATGGDDRSGRLWDTATGRLLRQMQGHAGAVYSVTFSPDGRLLATGSDDRSVRLWDTATGRLLRQMRGHAGAVRAVSFSPDGRTLATGAGRFDNGVKLWDVATGQEIQTLRVPDRGVWSVAFSPDRRTLAAGGDNGSIYLWRAAPEQGIHGSKLDGRKLDGRSQ